MVHLTSIAKDNEINQPLVDGMKKLDMGASSFGDTFTTTVYGSRFAAEDLPKHEMPECEMPKEVAYRMIKDDLSLDGNPMLKYATHSPAYLLHPAKSGHFGAQNGRLQLT
jgi:glutamate decarboxylase